MPVSKVLAPVALELDLDQSENAVTFRSVVRPLVETIRNCEIDPQGSVQILDQLEKTDIEDAGRMYTELFPAFVAPALVFLLIELLVLLWLRRWP